VAVRSHAFIFFLLTKLSLNSSGRHGWYGWNGLLIKQIRVLEQFFFFVVMCRCFSISAMMRLSRKYKKIKRLISNDLILNTNNENQNEKENC